MMASFPAKMANIWWQERDSRLHALCFVKASTSELPSLSVLMKSAGPVGLLIGHTWKDSAISSFCKKRQKYLEQFVRWLFSEQHMSSAQTTGQLRWWEIYPVKESQRAPVCPSYPGKEILLGIVNYSLIFSTMRISNVFLQAVILR